MSGADMVTFQPRTLRVLAWAFWVFALVALAAVALSFIGEPPPWNRVGRVLDAFGLAYLGALHWALAEARDDQ